MSQTENETEMSKLADNLKKLSELLNLTPAQALNLSLENSIFFLTDSEQYSAAHREMKRVQRVNANLRSKAGVAKSVANRIEAAEIAEQNVFAIRLRREHQLQGKNVSYTLEMLNSMGKTNRVGKPFSQQSLHSLFARWCKKNNISSKMQKQPKLIKPKRTK